MLDCGLAFHFHDLAKIGHIMAMATMVRVISSQISSRFGQYLVD
jgi:hypothetical protein